MNLEERLIQELTKLLPHHLMISERRGEGRKVEKRKNAPVSF